MTEETKEKDYSVPSLWNITPGRVNGPRRRCTHSHSLNSVCQEAEMTAVNLPIYFDLIGRGTHCQPLFLFSSSVC